MINLKVLPSSAWHSWTNFFLQQYPQPHVESPSFFYQISQQAVNGDFPVMQKSLPPGRHKRPNKKFSLSWKFLVISLTWNLIKAILTNYRDIYICFWFITVPKNLLYFFFEFPRTKDYTRLGRRRVTSLWLAQ